MKKTWNDSVLMQEFRTGNHRALRQVYDLYYPAICYFADKLVNNLQESEQIAADSFIKLWKINANFDTLPNVKAFLYITTRNACFNFLKYNKRQQTQYNDLVYMTDDKDDLTVLQAITRTEVLHEIYREIEALPPQCQKVFKLLYLEGLKAKEVAAAMNISVFTVRGQRRRALELLRTALLKRNLLALLVIVVHGK